MSNTTNDPSKPEAPLSLNARDPLAVRAAAVSVVTVLVGLAIAFGVPITDEQKVALVGAAAVLAPIAVALLSRPKVTANAKVIARVTTRGRVVAGEAAEQPSETVVATGDEVEVDADGPMPAVTVRPELLAAHPHQGDAVHEPPEGGGV